MKYKMGLIGTDISLASKFLKQGEVVSIPTETVYGLAANAYNEAAVSKVFSIKQRPMSNPLIIHIGDIEQINEFVKEIPSEAVILAQHFWPGPLTLLLPKKATIPDMVTAGSNKVAIRIPNHPVTLQLLKTIPFPLAAPSANPFGYVSPTTTEHVKEQLGDKIPYILMGGTCAVGIESTIVGFEDGKTIVYRLGGLEIASIEKLVGTVILHNNLTASNPIEKLVTPGSLSYHYSPNKLLKLGNMSDLLVTYGSQKVGILAFDQYYEGVNKGQQILLAPTGKVEEAAYNLFAALRELDQLDIDVILCSLVPHQGLGMAINDRLVRASASRI
ncbi:L-threonylcarbamoyladenylate synthase [Candidatus Amoebophilus asiaticus]|nr:L-threonylcarbamoyladenylate synthase [Candidatus Amoebophilus asiaticus]